jgi:hypothetical protein
LSDGEATRKKHEPWKPGESGNPRGRPKGARNRLGESFLTALETDFNEHGTKVIEAVRVERPHEYLKVVASLLPKQVEIKEGVFDGVADEQLAALIVAARSALGIAEGGGAGSTEPGGPQPASELQALH